MTPAARAPEEAPMSPRSRSFLNAEEAAKVMENLRYGTRNLVEFNASQLALSHESLRAEVESLRAQLGDARRDTERLDWLDANGWFDFDEEGCLQWTFGIAHPPEFREIYEDADFLALRDAIDSARSLVSPEPGTNGTDDAR